MHEQYVPVVANGVLYAQCAVRGVLHVGGGCDERAGLPGPLHLAVVVDGVGDGNVRDVYRDIQLYERAAVHGVQLLERQHEHLLPV